MKHIISVVVRNNSSVLARVSSLFGRRGFNIDSLSVSATEDPQISRITVVVNGDDASLDQVVKQTQKLIDTISVTVLREDSSVSRELLLIKVHSDQACVRPVVALCDSYGAGIVDISDNTMIIELTGVSGKIDKFVTKLLAMEPSGNRVLEVCRTGITAMECGKRDHETEENY